MKEMGSHNMEETSVQNTRKRKRRPSKRRTKLKAVRLNSSTGHSASPSRNLGVQNVIIKKRSTEKVNVSQCLNCVIRELCDQQIFQDLCAENEEKDSVECVTMKGNVLEQTVDLCDDSGLVNDSNSSLVILPSVGVEQKNKTVIDLSQDLTDQKEVIDLTVPYSLSQSAASPLEPTVIDISEDESKDKSKLKPENDDILVIGTFSKTSALRNKYEGPPLIQLSNTSRKFKNIINCSDKLKRKYLQKQSVFDKVVKKNKIQCRNKCQIPKISSTKVAKIGENVYVNSPVALPSTGLRPIIIDGSNVAFVHSNSNFSCKRLEICINYFKEKGHKVTAFVPQFRLNSHRSDDPQLLRKLERQGDVILTPSKKIDGRNIVPYDDRFIVQTAVLKGGIIVTRDNYNDLLKENPAWAETIKYRTLAFTWVDDVLMFPKDPLGEYGPTLEEFLKFH